MQPDPRRDALARPQAAQFAGEVRHMRPHLAPLPLAWLVPRINAISRGILRNNQKLFGASSDQFLRLTQHRVNPATCKLSAQRGNDAEGAAVVATFGNL